MKVHNINQNLLNIEYAVRGPLVVRAQQIQNEIDKGVVKPFCRVVKANIGDSHALGQKPITFVRQVLAGASYPKLLASEELPEDVKDRVRRLLASCTSGSIGSYSPSLGLRQVRQHCADFISERDGVPAHPDNIILGSGASDVIKSVLRVLFQIVDGRKPSIMIPVPQYPLFSGTLAEFGFHQASYFLDEERSWTVDSQELQRCWLEASKVHNVSALVVINPGNPTGQVLSRDTMEEIVRFAYSHGLLLMADEVYQQNIVSKTFHSFKKVITEMGPPYSTIELASFFTCSKGYVAECGLRSGFAELVNLDPGVEEALIKSLAVMQCPTVLGQLILDCVMKPPQPGDSSYKLFQEEVTEIHQVLSERVQMAVDAFNSIPGMSCNPLHGSMFAFPRMEIPARAQLEAKKLGMRPDEFYCMRLLEETGVCVVPGSGFGQKAGTFHFRTTILHQKEEFQYMLDAFTRFHRNFLLKYNEDIGRA